MITNTKLHLVTTVSYPTMNLSLNLYEEADAQKHPEFLRFVTMARRQQLLAVLRAKPYLPMFSPEHHIQPRVEMADAAA